MGIYYLIQNPSKKGEHVKNMEEKETSVNTLPETAFPAFFRKLSDYSCLSAGEIQHTDDGFYAVTKSIADILMGMGISTFLNDQNQERECSRFYDDWYLYAVPQNEAHVYGVYKMREQESDAEEDIPADGDTPGVTISFIAFDTESLAACLASPTPSNRKELNKEINRVVASRRQVHHKALKDYFNNPKAEGPYLIAELYVRHIAALAEDGYIYVPKHYAALYQRSKLSKASRKDSRLPLFLDSNNQAAGRTVCDHKKIYIQDSGHLSPFEKQAILATHTANVSFHSFAAEVRYHARFLVWYTRIPLPVIGHSVYDSAIRADMTIDDTEFEGPAPFYRLDSRLVMLQRKYHEG